MTTPRTSEPAAPGWTSTASGSTDDGPDGAGRPWGPDRVAAVAERVVAAVDSVVRGKSDVVRTAVATLLSGGHLLVEDVPGVGKTVLAKALARSIDCSVSRVQFTPDLLPSDVTGVTVYDRRTSEFDFRPGPVFANMVVADEINRASPKTQSALLECMEEHQVTVDGTTYPLAEPFMVLATQNPVEMEGTYPLPEAQRDRFTSRISLGYPAADAEIAMLDDRSRTDPLDRLDAQCHAADVRAMIDGAAAVHVAPELRAYVVGLVRATRSTPLVRLGGSPRATLHLLRTARARAVMAGRGYLLPDDVQAVAGSVLAHRLVLTGEARAARRTAADVVEEALHGMPVPRGGSGGSNGGGPTRHGRG